MSSARAGGEEALFARCPDCQEITYRKELERRWNVCGACGHHFRLTVTQRLLVTVDRGSFSEWDAALRATDPLQWVDSRPYPERLAEARRLTGHCDAVVTGSATIEAVPIALGIWDFHFLGGSMGTVVGERVARMIERAIEGRRPVVAFTASGGARMQEGTLSLFQMAKVASMVSRLRAARLPLLCVLTDPTTGGVAASLAMLGDVQIAEPRALIGFAGPRVVEHTIQQALPPGFQRAETVLEHGMIDRIVPRREIRAVLGSLLRVLAPATGPSAAAAAPTAVPSHG